MGTVPPTTRKSTSQNGRFFEVLLVLTIALIAMANARAQRPSGASSGSGVYSSGTVGGDIKDINHSYNTQSTTNIECQGKANCLGTNIQKGSGSVFAGK